MADNVTSTGIDALLKYVNDHGETEIPILAKVMKVDIAVAEQWASILENAKLVKVNYKLDKMFVAPLNISAVDLKAMSAEVEVRQKTITSDIKSKEELLSQIEERINLFDKFATDAQTVFKTNAAGVKKTLDQLHELRIRADAEFERVKSSKEYMDKLSSKIDSDLLEVRKKADSIKTGNFDADDARRLIDDLKDRLKLIDSESSSTQKKFSQSIAQQSKEANEAFANIRQEIKSLNDIIAHEEKQLEEKARINQNYSRDVEKVFKELDKRSSIVMDRTIKTKSDIDSIYDLAEKKTSSVNKDIDMYIAKFGEIGEIDKTIRDIKASLENARKDCEYCKQQFTLINAQLKEIDADKKLDEPTKNEKIKDIGSKVEEIDSKMDKIRQDVEDSAPDRLIGKSATE